MLVVDVDELGDWSWGMVESLEKRKNLTQHKTNS